MSKLKTLIENLLLEARVYRISNGNSNFRDLRILKNPSRAEYEQFKSNTITNSIRGVVINGDVYITDAHDIIHDHLVMRIMVDILGEVTDDIFDISHAPIDAMFEEDEFGNFGLRKHTTANLKNLEKIIPEKYHTGDNVNNAEGYFRRETDYKIDGTGNDDDFEWNPKVHRETHPVYDNEQSIVSKHF